jgi:mono/diheme cytochrome c family protein
MTNTPNRSTPVLPVYIALGLLVIVSIAFIALIYIASTTPEGGADVVSEVSADSYMDVVTPLLANADPVRGEELITRNGCHACHVIGAANNLAPAFAGVALRAEDRCPPMQAGAYIYESIVHPEAFEVEGYTAQMPRTYGTILSDQDLGDIIAYLLTLRTPADDATPEVTPEIES